MSLMQDTLPFAPTLQLRHATLVTFDDSHDMLLDYASYQVGLHKLEEAIETLERGEPYSGLHLGSKFAAVTSWVAPTRRDTAQSTQPALGSGRGEAALPVVHAFAGLVTLYRGPPILEKRPSEVAKGAGEIGRGAGKRGPTKRCNTATALGINRDLEEFTKSIPPSHKLSVGDSAADSHRVVDPFGCLLLKQRRLLKKRDELISQVQALPGFDNFLTPPPFDTLRSAALSGPVIIINHCGWRSDILILLHNTSPSLISTPV
ncbi:hypothetical protein EDB87DRAFT_1755705 [Lactarius vividus]|nr:hypothetical protein EDB87DRAFT_1755705 [Lactarius vividus]